MNKNKTSYNFLFDLDGTVTRAEILPVIARELGLEQEMEILTEKAMSGEVPFDHSFRTRVDILKSVPISRIQEIIAEVPVHKLIEDFISEHKQQCFIVTGNLDVWLKPLIERLDIPFFTSVADCTGNSLHGVKEIIRKVTILDKLDGPCVAIGDGSNDAEMIEAAEIGIAFGSVHRPAAAVLEVASHAIYEEHKLCQLLQQLS